MALDVEDAMGAGERSLWEQNELSNSLTGGNHGSYPCLDWQSRDCSHRRRGDLCLVLTSRATWSATSLSPASGGRMSRHTVRGGDVSDLLSRFAHLQTRAYERTGTRFPLVIIHEAGLDGFWIHRVLEQEGIESHVVDPASIAASRRARRAKTDRVDGEMWIGVQKGI